MAERRITVTGYDDQQLQCPRLGSEVRYEYCRTKGGDLPCCNLLACWWDKFDVADYIRQTFSAEQVSQMLAPQKDKLASLVDLLAQASEETTS